MAPAAVAPAAIGRRAAHATAQLPHSNHENRPSSSPYERLPEALTLIYTTVRAGGTGAMLIPYEGATIDVRSERERMHHRSEVVA
jgi:hypothetical protein